MSAADRKSPADEFTLLPAYRSSEPQAHKGSVARTQQGLENVDVLVRAPLRS